jgi:hypothetical protein
MEQNERQGLLAEIEDVIERAYLMGQRDAFAHAAEIVRLHEVSPEPDAVKTGSGGNLSPLSGPARREFEEGQAVYCTCTPIDGEHRRYCRAYGVWNPFVEQS